MNALAMQQAQLKRAIVSDAAQAADAAAALLRTRAQHAPLLHIYQDAYAQRLISALRDNFGVLPRVLGDEGFGTLARAYIAEHPSRHLSIRWFGHRLSDFMAAREDLVPHPAMVDLARMEWALRSAFDAADALPLTAEALAGVAPEAWPQLIFEPLPSVQILALEWNVEPVWRALQTEAGDAEPELPEPEPLPHGLLIWRAGLNTRWRSLEGLARSLLGAALAGQNFGLMCELAAREVGEEAAALNVASALRHWIDDGLLAGWRISAR